MELVSKLDLSGQSPVDKHFEGIHFSACTFANANLSSCKFIDCCFSDCDLSMAQLRQASFQDVTFKGCKLLGLQFDKCSAFALSFSFENCLMDHVVFFKVKLSGTRFTNCRIQEADFTDAIADKVTFEKCDLASTVFERTSLLMADFRTAWNYAIDPELNKLKGARFSEAGLRGLLLKYKLNIES